MIEARIVGVDYGTKRVGLALADPLRMFAQPIGAFSHEECIHRLKRISKTEGLETIVIGWPLTESGEEGQATERVQKFIDRLRNALPDVQIVKRDERYTSEMAKDRLREGGISHTRDKKGRVDAGAAAILLEEYLAATG